MTTADIVVPTTVPTTNTSSTDSGVVSKTKKGSKTAASKTKVSKTKGTAATVVASHKVSTHPKYNEMIGAAISALKERTGSSRHAIVKYIMANYQIESNAKVVNAHVKASLKKAVTDGHVKQAKGVGASGSFRIGDKKSGEKRVKKTKTTGTPKKPKTKKIVKAKTTTVPKVKNVKPTTATKKKVATKVVAPVTKVTKKTALKPKVAKPKVSAGKTVKKTTTATKKTKSKIGTK